MKLLVAGASGFLGRNLLLALPKGIEVTALYRSAAFPSFLAASRLDDVVGLQADLSQPEGAALVAAAGPFDACVFLAANGDPALSVKRPAFDLLSNCASLVNLLERCRLGTLVFLSSGAVYDGLQGPVSPESCPRPRLPYAVSKLAAEGYIGHFCRQGAVERAAIIRFFGAYGPYEPSRKVYSRLVRRFGIERGNRFTIRGDGTNLIDAMYVSEAVRALLLVLAAPLTDRMVFDLYSGEPLTLTELVVRAAGVFGVTPEIEYEGEVPERIEFRSVDRTMSERFAFTPSVDLESGLLRLRDHLLAAV
jgi:nucleoside-diphosphate-sugar epimerase